MVDSRKNQCNAVYAFEKQSIRCLDETKNGRKNSRRFGTFSKKIHMKKKKELIKILNHLSIFQGDLGGIDAKYDVAISTCCGRLDNIVVDTVNTAQACIEYLKASDIGRATFIALEKVSYLAAKAAQPIQT